VEKTKDIEIAYINGELINTIFSDTEGLSLRGIHDDKMDIPITEEVDEFLMDMLIEEAYEKWKNI